MDPTTELERLRLRLRELEAQQAERDRVEAGLRESESWYRSLFEEAAVSIWETDWSAVKPEVDSLRAAGVQDLGGHLRAHPDLTQALVDKVRVVDFNNATLEIYRAPDRETLRRGMDEFLKNTTHWDDFPFVVEALANGDCRHVMECRKRTLGGNEIFIRIMRRVPAAHRDTWARVIVVVEDITEHKRAEDLSTRLGRIVEASIDEVYVFDARDLRFIQVNRGARDNLGYSLDELRELTPLDLKPELTAEQFNKLIDALRNGDQDQVIFTTVQRRKDGSTYDAEVRLQLSRADTPPVFVAMIQDVTERNQAQETQRQALSHLGHAQRIARLGHWEWRLKDERLYPSQGMAEIFGISKEGLHITDEDYLTFVHPRDRKRVARAFGESDQVNETYETEYRIIRPDGEERVLFEIGEPAFDAAGKPVGMFGTVQDVTELKKAELELKSAKQRAELASRAKSEFLANTSHELRTPLNVIIGFSELIIHDPNAVNSAPKHLKYAEDIRRSGRHLLELINDILDLSKIEMGKLALEESLVDLGAVIGACSDQLTEPAVAAGLQLTQQFEEPLAPVWADKTKIKQMLLNLISNAIKFTPRGGAIAVTATMDRQRGVSISVSDTGIGIAPDKIPLALETFGQVDGGLSRKFEGTGLGLPLTKALAELHGGELRIESEIGRGTTVTVSLPRARLRRIVA